ncbi:MAG: GNAT family N-acetyltransferase [Candidatus Hadarchaeales archaeon]
MQIETYATDESQRYECWDHYGCSIVASAVVIRRDGYAYLKDINVSSSQRGKGIGTELLSRIISDFGSMHIVADVFADRLSWYERHGFEEIGRNNHLIKIVRFPWF